MAALDLLGNWHRTHYAGDLRAADADKDVVLMGWVHRRRDLGNLIFIDVRDRGGIAQIVFNKELGVAAHARAEELRAEYVVAIRGRVALRQKPNTELASGEVEIFASELRILNTAKTPPFVVEDEINASEETRLHYRYLDLRRPRQQRNLALRHRVVLEMRRTMDELGFYEIETPILTRSTPEGARDYLVPSRVHHGQFYALPQSPQLFKQILMISGFDKYFQIVRCFRDEDLRADRQPEFTQIDLEMSFPRPETVFRVVEGFLQAAFSCLGVRLETPFPLMAYDEAIRLYGIDKPDLRLPPLAEVSSAFAPENLQGLGLDTALPVVAVRIPAVGELSRKERDDLRQIYPAKLQQQGIKILDDSKRLEKSFPEAMAKVREMSGAQSDDYIVVVASGAVSFGDGGEGQKPPSGAPHPQAGAGTAGNRARLSLRERQVYEGAGQVRLALAQKFADRHKLFQRTGGADDFRLLWVTDFPMFEWDETERRWNAAHHPFTSPHEEDMDKLESDPGAVRSLAYDVVLNGMELGSGSIRIHRQDIQAKIFKSLGMSPEEQQSRFGFFLEALQYGTPPHGGIALGLDRIVMILAGAESLREVIPFPKTAKAVDLMVDAPTPVSERQLKELGISVTKANK